MRSFRYDDLLSAADGRLVSRRHMEAVYDVFNYLTVDGGVTTLALLHLWPTVKAHLQQHLPVLTSDAVAAAITKALDEWKTVNPANPTGLDKVIHLNTLMDRHVLPLMPGEFMEVPQMSAEANQAAVDTYGDFLNEKLAGKEVIGVVV